MRRTLALATVLATTVVGPTPLRADSGPPLRPTMFLVVQRDGMSATRLRRVRAALLRTLPKLPKTFRAVVITEGDARTPRVTAALAGRAAKQLVAPLARGTKGPTRRFGRLLAHVISLWGGSSSTPRHHAIVIPAAVPTATDHSTTLRYGFGRGFTVSFLLPSKPSDKVAKQLAAGAGHVLEVGDKALARSLAQELAWAKLSAADLRLRARLQRQPGPMAVLGVLRGGVGGVFGRGGLGLKGRAAYVPQRFARGDVIVGKQLAVGLRRLACAQLCDVADVRKQLLAKGQSLLACLERDVKLPSPRDILRVALDDKLETPAARCVRAWRKQLGQPGLTAQVEIGDARAVR